MILTQKKDVQEGVFNCAHIYIYEAANDNNGFEYATDIQDSYCYIV